MKIASKLMLTALGGALLLPLMAVSAPLSAADLAEKLQSEQGKVAQQKDPLDLLMQRYLDGESLSPAEKMQLAPRFEQPNAVVKGNGQAVTQVWGPDEFGYSAYDETEENGMAFDWIDHVEAGMTEIWVGEAHDDTWSGYLDLGFNFPFYDDVVSQVQFSANAVIMVGNAGVQPSWGYRLPDDAVDYRLIDPWSNDMYHTATTYTGYAQLSNPDRFVVSWEGLGSLATQDIVQTFQVILYATGDILFQYGALDDSGSPCESSGIDHTGTRSLNVGDSSTHYEGQAILFNMIPPAYAVSASPATVNMGGGPGDVVNGLFTIINTGDTADSYELNLTIDQLDVVLSHEGTPLSNTGIIQPDGEFVVDVSVTIPGDAQTLDDMASVSINSDNSEVFDTVTLMTSVINAAGGGPDAWGNTWTSSGGGDVDYFWVDLPDEDRTIVTLSDDAVDGPFEMGGTLEFYGIDQTQFYVGSNGLWGFASDFMNSLSNQVLPNPNTPNSLVALFWDDLNPNNGGEIYYGHDDQNRLVITYDTVSEYGGNGTLTAQSVVDFDAGVIYNNYQSLAGDIDVTSCTIGIENSDGSDALQVLANTDPFVPVSGWTIQLNLTGPPEYLMGLEDNVSVTGPADSEVSTTVTVYNFGTLADSYSLTASATAGVNVDILINGTPGNVTPTVAIDDSFDIELLLDIPEIPTDLESQITLTATSQGDGSVSDETTVILNIVTVQGGPDSYGYFWSTTDADGRVEYDWVTLTAPTVIDLGDDAFAGPFDMGFSWNHYGIEHTQIYIGSNGMIGFGETGMTSLGNQGIPDVNTPNDLIAWFWDDLNPASGGTVSYASQDGMFIVEFNAVPEFGSPDAITAQVILDTNEDAVRINFQNLDPELDILSTTIGMENADGTEGFWCDFNGEGWLPSNGSAVWFGFNVIGPVGPYAVDISPDAVSGVGLTGGFASYEFEVENRGENPSAFSLATDGNAWDMSFHDVDDDWAEITGIPEMVAEEIFNLGVRVHVPEEPASFTDLAILTVASTVEPETAFVQADILTAASCSHISQLTQNLTGPGLFGMEHLSDGEGVNAETVVWLASGVNRFVEQNPQDGTVGTISTLPFGPLYLGLAFDSRDNSYWVSYLGGISHVESNGTLIEEFSPALLDESTGRVPTGLAFDADADILWVVCSHGATDDVIRIDIADAAIPVELGVANLPWTSGIAGAAGVDYHEGSDQLIAVNQSTGTVECFLDLGNGELDARGDFCPSGLAEPHGLALSDDGNVLLGGTSGLAHPVESYLAPCSITGVEGDAFNLPAAFNLAANYPNPFNPSTMLRVEMPMAGHVRLEVYNLIGQRQSLLLDHSMPAGRHDLRFDGSNLSSGVYFYRVTVTDNSGNELYSSVRKMMLMK